LRMTLWSPRSNNGPAPAYADNPAHGCLATAKHRALDHVASANVSRSATREARPAADSTQQESALQIFEAEFELPTNKICRFERLPCFACFFISCHPGFRTEARVALTLRLSSWRTDTQDRARFSCSERPSVGNCIRADAKRTLTEARVPLTFLADAERTAATQSSFRPRSFCILIFNEAPTPLLPTAGRAKPRMPPALFERCSPRLAASCGTRL